LWIVEEHYWQSCVVFIFAFVVTFIIVIQLGFIVEINGICSINGIGSLGDDRQQGFGTVMNLNSSKAK
jgi:hypothetical protein